MKIFVQGVVAGFAIFVVSFLVSYLTSLFFPGINKEYVNESIFRPWTDPLMMLYYVYPFVLGIILSFIWGKTSKLLTEKSYFKRGLMFGVVYWVASSIPGMFITYSSFQLSLGLVLIWSIGGLLEAVAAGTILAWMNR